MDRNGEIAYALLRVTVGVMFFFFGLGKLVGGHREFVSGLEERFAGSWLPQALVTPFATVLPFAEMTIGALVVLGLFSVLSLVLAALLMLALTFGTVVEPDPAGVARNVNYALILAALLFLVRYNRFSLDHARGAGPAREGTDA